MYSNTEQNSQDRESYDDDSIPSTQPSHNAQYEHSTNSSPAPYELLDKELGSSMFGTQAVALISPQQQAVSDYYSGVLAPCVQVYIFAITAMSYFSLMITHFGDHKNYYSLGIEGQYSMWAFIINIVIIAVGYSWSVIAPILFPDRDFDSAE